MITIQKQPLLIEDLGKHTPDDIAEVRMLLEAGMVGQPDSNRPYFYELDGVEQHLVLPELARQSGQKKSRPRPLPPILFATLQSAALSAQTDTEKYNRHDYLQSEWNSAPV